MGKRGPKPGFKKAREAAAAASAPSVPAAKKPRAAAKKVAAPAPAPAAKQPPPPIDAPLPKPAEAPVLSAADRENPNKLSGQALRELAHQRGMARSVLADMPDEKIRMELRYITNNQYADDALA